MLLYEFFLNCPFCHILAKCRFIFWIKFINRCWRCLCSESHTNRPLRCQEKFFKSIRFSDSEEFAGSVGVNRKGAGQEVGEGCRRGVFLELTLITFLEFIWKNIILKIFSLTNVFWGKSLAASGKGDNLRSGKPGTECRADLPTRPRDLQCLRSAIAHSAPFKIGFWVQKGCRADF